MYYLLLEKERETTGKNPLMEKKLSRETGKDYLRKKNV